MIEEKEEFIKKLSIDNKIIVKRCTENYLRKHNLYDWLISNTPEDFTTIQDKIKFLIYGGGYCLVCGTRTNHHVSGKGFGKYCKLHFHEPKKNKKARNYKEVDIDLIKDLYLKQKKSVLQISKELGNISNVTISKNLKKAGIEFRSRPETSSLCSIPRDKIGDFDREWWIAEYTTKSSYEIANELGCSPSLVLQRLSYHGIERIYKDTYPEKRIMEFLDSINIKYEKKVRGLFDGNKEIDIYIPEISLGIEINGIHWHSDQYKDSTYHKNKTEKCIENNIELLHFWDIEVLEKFNIIVGIIKSKLGLNQKLYARKCEVKEVNSKIAKEFIIKNHIQGWVNAKLYYGLYYNNQLVSIASFSKPRYNKNYDWELIRFCSCIGITVVGGLSKLLNRINGSIISYANRRWSLGNVYEKCGFKLINTTKPAYFYYKGSIIYNRVRFQKHKLKNMEHYSSDKTEQEIMKLNGYKRIWDCGQLVYIKS